MSKICSLLALSGIFSLPASFAIQLSMEGVATTNESHAPEQPLSPLNPEDDAFLGDLLKVDAPPALQDPEADALLEDLLKVDTLLDECNGPVNEPLPQNQQLSHQLEQARKKRAADGLSAQPPVCTRFLKKNEIPWKKRKSLKKLFN